MTSLRQGFGRQECPTCGQDIPRDSRVVVSLEDNAIVVDGEKAVLTSYEAEIMSVLSRRIGHAVMRDTLMSAVYPIDADSPDSTKVLDVLIHRIRRKTAHLNIRIETIWGRDYRLEHGNPDL